MSSYDDDPMFCATCRRGLAQLSGNAGAIVIGYRHALAGPDTAGHDPQPVPLSALAGLAVLKCDFCSAEGQPGSASGPQWVYLAESTSSQDRHIVAETVAQGDYRERHQAARRLTIKTEGGMRRHWGERWAACAACAELIEAHNVLTLVARAIERMPAQAVRGRRLPMARGRLIDTYEHLFATLAPGRGRITPEHPIGGEWS
jgi:hypothetical protein